MAISGLAAAIAACSPSDTGSAEPGGGSGDASSPGDDPGPGNDGGLTGEDGGIDGSKPRRSCAGFASSGTAWPLPDAIFYKPFQESNPSNWTTIDLDGDGRPDFVRTADPAKTSSAFGVAGAASWQLWKNTGSGFATSPVTWAVPDPLFYKGAQESNPSNWSTIDLDGDGKVDLVRTADPAKTSSAFGSLGAASWQVWKNTGTGFAATSVSWAVPDPLFYKPYQESNPSNWSTIDLDGDGKVDLVRTADPAKTSSAFGVAGAASWQVWKNTGTGFAASPVSWSVPDPLFYKPYQESNPSNWSTLDLDGDGKVDLVRTADPAKTSSAFGAAGAASWQVWKNTGTGFAATAVSWPVPDAGFYKPFQEANPSNWTTMDLTGDGKPDLVRTADPTKTSSAFGGAGASSWEIWKNTGAGFATSASSWPVPEPAFYKGFQESNPSNWSTLDLDGDGCMDLVRTADPTKTSSAFTAGAGASWQAFAGK